MASERDGDGHTTTAHRWRWIWSGGLALALLILPLCALWLAPRPRSQLRQRATRTATVTTILPLVGAAPRRAVGMRPGEVEEGSEATAALAVAGVEGMVLDPEGRPLAGATVKCSEEGRPAGGSTDDRGHFALTSEAEGCSAVAVHATFQPSEPTPIFAGKPNVLRVRQGGSLEGDVVDELGKPITAYTLAVESYWPANGVAASGPGAAKNVDDPTGAFAWPNLAAGTYVLTASAAGRPPARSRSAEVELGRATRNLRITLAKGATLTGRVIDGTTRRGVHGATVALDAITATGANVIRPAQSDENGTYTLDGAPQGPFSVRVTHASYRTRVLSGLTTGGQSVVRQDVELHPLTDGGAQEEYMGIGAVLAPSAKGVAIVSTVVGGPAEHAGLRAGDRIVRIDGADAQDWPMTQCVQLLRGPDGSIVTVRVERDGHEVEMTIVRRALER